MQPEPLIERDEVRAILLAILDVPESVGRIEQAVTDDDDEDET